MGHIPIIPAFCIPFFKFWVFKKKIIKSVLPNHGQTERNVKILTSILTNLNPKLRGWNPDPVQMSGPSDNQTSSKLISGF